MAWAKSKRPTISDVASYAGVSIATVSRVVNGTAPVSGDVARKVNEAIEALHFRPTVAARNLATRRTNTIGLVSPSISGDYFPLMLRGIEAATRETGYDLLVFSTQGRLEQRQPNFPFPVGDHNTDGLLIFINALPQEELAYLDDLGFPMVLLFQAPPAGRNIPCLNVENIFSTEAIVEHLIRVHQRKRIVILHGPQDQADAVDREQGYRQALQKNGLVFDPRLRRFGNFDKPMAEASVNELLGEGIDFDAIFASDDESAVGALAALYRAGKRVPQDVSLVGFDDIALAPYLNPPLTTVQSPLEELGRRGVYQLDQKIRTGQTDLNVVLPTHMIIRKSCGCE